MSARDSILARIREALRVGAPRRSGGSEAQPRDRVAGVRQVLPKVPDDYPGQVALFAERSEVLKTEFLPCSDESAASAQLKILADREKWESVALPAEDRIRAWLSTLALSRLEVSRSTVKTDLEKVSAGITGCDALIAQTGSVLLTSQSAGGRALSVLPVHHVVIATSDQLVPDLPAAFELLEHKYAPNYPSFMTFITGPSRTGDIERVLVLGAHGPRKLSIILIGAERTAAGDETSQAI